MHVCVSMCGHVPSEARGIRLTGVPVTGGCELAGMDDGKGTLALGKSGLSS